MRLYDVALVLRSATTSIQKEKLLETVKKWLGEAKVAKVEEWGKKKLSYPIKKENEGYYVILSVESGTGLKGDFEKRLLMEEAILRHLVLRKD
ncbi:30S ribosomal protein S6 [Candidatus Microgenomates bacterium]|nr:30S ribosomal protein S6 [Candidatus Microgenomates bacterium]